MRKVRGSFLFVGSNQGRDYGRKKNLVEEGKEKKKKEKKKKGKKKKKGNEKKRKERKKGKKREDENPCVEEKGERKENGSDFQCFDS